MEQPQTIKIDDVIYVREDSKTKTSGDIRIVILQRGWVMVGRFSQEGPNCRLEDAAVIRVWGTSKGLGEIAAKGPTSKTVLDKTPSVNFHELTVIATIDCVEALWVKVL